MASTCESQGGKNSAAGARKNLALYEADSSRFGGGTIWKVVWEDWREDDKKSLADYFPRLSR